MLSVQQPVGWVRQNWQKILVTGLLLGLASFLLLYRLGSLVHGVSDQEVTQRAFAGDWHHIMHNPLGAPLTVVQWLCLTVFGHQGQTVIRLASTLFGLLTIGAMAYIFRRWYGRKTAIFGTILFATSAWFLHVSRYGGPDIMYLWAVPTLLAAQIAWDRRGHSPLSTFLLGGLVAILLYIPGMFWIIVVSFGLQVGQVTAAWRRLNDWRLRAAWPVSVIVLLLPLLIAISQNSKLWLNWLGFPDTISPTNIPRNLAHAISFFVWRGPATPTVWLDRLPILTVFSLVMLLLGIIFYVRHAGAARSRTLLGMFIVGAVFFAVQGPVTISLLVPIVYAIVVAGLGYFLQQWLRVFPRNPLARSFAYAMLACILVLVVTYNTRAYFIAWPHNATTQLTFHNHL